MRKTHNFFQTIYLLLLCAFYTSFIALGRVYASAWTNTTVLPQTIEDAASVSYTNLSGTYIYDIGGYNGSSQANTVYIAKVNSDGTVNAWNVSSSHLPQGVSDPAVALFNTGTNGYIYSIGGFTGSSQTNVVSYASINSDGTLTSWTTSPNNLPQSLEEVTTNVYTSGGISYLYAIGGFDGSLNQLSVYYAQLNSDGSLGSWITATHALPQRIKGSTSVLVTTITGTYLYILGGTTVSALQTTFYTKLNNDGSPGNWILDGSALLQAVNEGASVVYYAGSYTYIYVYGGDDGSSPSSKAFYAQVNDDGSLNGWSNAPALLPQGAEDLSGATTSTGYIYEIGGSNGSLTNTVSFIAANALAPSPTPTPTPTPSPTPTATSTSTPTASPTLTTTPTTSSSPSISPTLQNGKSSSSNSPIITSQAGTSIPLVYIPNTTPTIETVSIPNMRMKNNQNPIQSAITNIGKFLPGTPGVRWSFITLLLGVILTFLGWTFLQIKQRGQKTVMQENSLLKYKLLIHKYETKFQKTKKIPR